MTTDILNKSNQVSYQRSRQTDANSFITDPSIPDPDNLPQPLGWNMLVRPYPIESKSSIIIPEDEINFMNFQMNIGRVVSIGPCCWNRPHHRNMGDRRFQWVEVGDFISYPKNKGHLRKFKGVSFIILGDDDITERLVDPMVLEEDGLWSLNIPEEDLKKYNTIHKEYKVGEDK
jgi:co-chaperonin GroES (HSP10)